MKLFFETAGQAQAFLTAVPLGLLLAACLDASALTGPLRPLADALLVLGGGLALMAAMLLVRDETLRMYHLLALLTGAVLYRPGDWEAGTHGPRPDPKAKKNSKG